MSCERFDNAEASLFAADVESFTLLIAPRFAESIAVVQKPWQTLVQD